MNYIHNLSKINSLSHKGAGSSSYSTTARELDGTDDYYNGVSLLSVADSKQLTLSAWVSPSSLSGVKWFFYIGQNRVRLGHNGSQVLCDMRDVADTVIATKSGGALTVDQGNTILISVDAAVGTFLMYVNDVLISTTAPLDLEIEFSQNVSGIGAQHDGQSKYAGCIAHLGVSNTFVDFSVAANRRLFFSSAGKPVSSGGDGSDLFGSQPPIWVPDGNAANNKGSLGDYTENGSPGICSLNPTD